MLKRISDRARKCSATLLSCRNVSKATSCDTIFLFPGQGSQERGMCRESVKIPAIQDMFSEASNELGYDLSRVCIEGPDDELSRTDVCQPAVVVSSLASAKLFEMEQGHPDWGQSRAAGYSVGEITALIHCGAIDFKAGIRLIQARGKAMQRASEQLPGAMLSTRGLTAEQIEALCERCLYLLTRPGTQTTCSTDQEFYLGLSSQMAKEAFILAGHREAVELAEQCAAEMGASHAQRLAVSGAFHTPLMEGACEDLSAAIASTAITMPLCPVYSNVTGQPFSSVEEIRELLLKQVTSPVLWYATIADLRSNTTKHTRFVELGPGRTLTASLVLSQRRLSRNCINVQPV